MSSTTDKKDDAYIIRPSLFFTKVFPRIKHANTLLYGVKVLDMTLCQHGFVDPDSKSMDTCYLLSVTYGMRNNDTVVATYRYVDSSLDKVSRYPGLFTEVVTTKDGTKRVFIFSNGTDDVEYDYNEKEISLCRVPLYFQLELDSELLDKLLA